MDDIHKNIEEYNPNNEHIILVVFLDMIADTLSNKKLNRIVDELFIRCRKLIFSFVLMAQFYFAVSKNIR